jgi:hypothetical protein
VETSKVTVYLNSAVTNIPLPGANISFVQDFVANLLRTAFPHLTDNQIKITVQGLFNLDQDIPAFKEHLRDFLVQVTILGISRFFGTNLLSQINAGKYLSKPKDKRVIIIDIVSLEL